MGAHAVCFNQSKGKGRGEKQNTNSHGELSLASLKRPPAAGPPSRGAASYLSAAGLSASMEHSQARHLSIYMVPLACCFSIDLLCSVLFVGLSTWLFVFLLFAAVSVVPSGPAGRWSISYNIFVLFDLRLATIDHSLVLLLTAEGKSTGDDRGCVAKCGRGSTFVGRA